MTNKDNEISIKFKLKLSPELHVVVIFCQTRCAAQEPFINKILLLENVYA